MNACRLEPDAIRAAATGEWTSSLRTHVNGCADCAAAAEVGPWMEEFARLDDRTKALRAGYQAHVPKPIDAAELIAVIASLRRGAGKL